VKEGVFVLYPNRLRKGDRVGVIAPAGPPDQESLLKGVSFLEKELDLKIKLGKHINSAYGYLAGKDEERLNDFHEMVKDPDIQGIIFARGGYGTSRIASQIDYELIKQNPKVIWGYSDITYLHTTIRQTTGLITFHGPMVATDMANKQFDEKSKKMFNQLFEPTELHYTEEYSKLEVLNEGKSFGQLVGGNLSLLTSTIGTPFEIDTKDNLLLLEDIGEVPYRIDAMLNQLKHAGKLDDVAGIIIGDFAKATPKKDSLSLKEVFNHYFAELDCPVMCGFKIGHCFPHFAVPLGTWATMDTSNKTLLVKPGIQ